jgi:hypothetical protein
MRLVLTERYTVSNYGKNHVFESSCSPNLEILSASGCESCVVQHHVGRGAGRVRNLDVNWIIGNGVVDAVWSCRLGSSTFCSSTFLESSTVGIQELEHLRT